jgi:hypothetical protein
MNSENLEIPAYVAAYNKNLQRNQGGVMKNKRKIHPVVLFGSLAGTCLMATVAFANPAMLPDHPGHPMKPLKSPVTGQSLANDPGEEPMTGQKALNAAIQEGNRDLKTRTRASIIEEEKMEERKESMGKSMKTQ